MSFISQTLGKVQIQDKGAIASQIQTQSIIMMQTQELEARINLELMHNPALELEDSMFDEEDLSNQQEEEGRWDEDFDIHIDEMETGLRNDQDTYELADLNTSLERHAIDRWRDNPERLGKAIRAIDDFKHSGTMTDEEMIHDLSDLEALHSLQKDILTYPDIEIIINNGQVEAYLVQNKGDFLKYKPHMGNDTQKAKKFIADIQNRKRVLQKLSDLLLTELQRNFFLENELSGALLNLLPLRISDLSNYFTDELFSSKSSMEKFIYRSENLIVSCPLGLFPFNFFMPGKPAILLMWIKEAQNNRKVKQEEQREWIIDQFENRMNKWPFDDRRCDFPHPLLNISIDDIKNANKKAKRNSL